MEDAFPDNGQSVSRTRKTNAFLVLDAFRVTDDVNIVWVEKRRKTILITDGCEFTGFPRDRSVRVDERDDVDAYGHGKTNLGRIAVTTEKQEFCFHMHSMIIV